MVCSIVIGNMILLISLVMLIIKHYLLCNWPKRDTDKFRSITHPLFLTVPSGIAWSFRDLNSKRLQSCRWQRYVSDFMEPLSFTNNNVTFQEIYYWFRLYDQLYFQKWSKMHASTFLDSTSRAATPI